MKKTLSYILSFLMLITAVFCVPFTSQAATYKPDRKIYAESYMLINLDDDSYPVVAEKNPDERLYPASLTKIVTAMVVINNVKDFNATTKMSQSAFDATLGTGAQVAGIKVGEEITIDKLLYLTMVHSACDACQVLAEYVSGSSQAFVAEMNKWVQSLGCKDTNFVNPDGLHNDNHYTTARDMSIITLEALKNPNFVKYATATSVDYDGMTLHHTNLMLSPGYVTYYYEYAQGIKTGSTDEAEYCVITKASKDGYNYLAIVLKSPQQKIKGQSYLTKCSFVDAKSLFEWAFDSLKYTTLISKGEVISEIAVENGKDADSVQLVAKDDTNVIVPAGLDKSAVIYDVVEKPESISAPVSKGDYVCSANVIYADEVIATVDLVAAKDIELSTFLKMINAIKSFFSLTIVKIICVVAVIALVIYVYVLYSNLKKKKKNEAKKQARRERYDDGPDDLPPPRRRR
ncbi:MAG: D-alanyl-D-alanine carboxypeptidase [Eubacteriales bacterium]|nr:D-alanyl-D-alanine carboxypeptidase [Eubacteriales bacterium]